MMTCDQCDVDVRAVVTISLPSGKILTFCGHHADANAYALLKNGAIILDSRETLVATT